MKIKWISTTENEIWKDNNPQFLEAGNDTLELTGVKNQTIDGFGGCFNELGWIALSKIDEKERKKVISEIFHAENGCKFNFCRTPMGASDYADQWYSYNENDGDYSMDKFSIERDHSYLIPYIKEAQKLQPELKLFASPWSPPTWMKYPKAYNYGTLRMEKKVLEAYALYFKKYVEAYKKEGIHINQVHVQNEPFADQKFPSCLWTGEQYRVFIRDYIGPLFEKENLDTELWFGTLNGPTPMSFTFAGMKLQSYAEYVDRVLFDEEARKYITGIGYQWAGQNVIQRTHESFPELKLMQTENECGDGTNTWEYARYIFGLLRHYFNNGVNSYAYWNMVLEPKGNSTWGWQQNSMITIDPHTKTVIYNPEFYLMKHFSHFVAKGAVKLEAKGHFTGTSLAFENPNGEIVLIVSNDMDMNRKFTFKGNGKEFSVELKANSFNTIIL